MGVTEKDFTSPQELLASVARWAATASDAEVQALWTVANGELDRRLDRHVRDAQEWVQRHE